MAKIHPLRQYREAQQPPLSQVDLAERLGVTRASVSRWEAGERFPGREHWPAIKRVTGLSPDDLAKAKAAVHRAPAEADDDTKPDFTSRLEAAP